MDSIYTLVALFLKLFYIHKYIYNVQHSQAKLESEARAVARWWELSFFTVMVMVSVSLRFSVCKPGLE